MSTTIPSAIGSEIDRWLEMHGRSINDWCISSVSGSGNSIAQVWRLAPRPNALSLDGVLRNNENTELGFAIRNWGRHARDRESIERILFFQKAVHIGLSETNASNVSLFDKLSASSIVPDVMNWSDRTRCREYDHSIWTIETWRPGGPVVDTSIVTDSLLQQASDTLERLHAIGRQLGVRCSVAPGLNERSQCFARWRSIERSTCIRRIDELGSKIFSILMRDQWIAIVDRTLEHLQIQARSIDRNLQRLLSSPMECHWIVRDLWRENILIDHDRISGIIDFGASRIDWPAFDIVRWFSSWLEPGDSRVLNLLENRNALSVNDYRFLDCLSTLLSLLQWFDWLLFSERSFHGKEDQVRSRMTELDRRLDKMRGLGRDWLFGR